MATELLHPLGRTVEHDERSRSVAYRAAQAPLRSRSFRRWGKTLDQDGIGSCVGDTVIQSLNCTPLRQGRKLGTQADAFRIYSRATQLDSFPGYWSPGDPKSIDTGTSALAGGKAAVEAGKIRSYHHTFGIDQMLGALVLSPVWLGIGWRDSMWETDSRGYLDTSGSVVGGHEVAVTAIDLQREAVRIQNHWYNEDGSVWGIDGCAWILFEGLDSLLADKGDVVVPVV